MLCSIFKNLTAIFQVPRLTHLLQKSVKKNEVIYIYIHTYTYIYIYMVTSAGDLTEILNMLAIINQAALYVAIYLSFFFFWSTALLL